MLTVANTAHRTLITRKLKGLEDIIPFTAVHWHMQELGIWGSSTAFPMIALTE